MRGGGGGQIEDYKIQFRAMEGVDLLYKVPQSFFSPFSRRHKPTSLYTRFPKCDVESFLCVFVVKSSKTRDPCLS